MNEIGKAIDKFITDKLLEKIAMQKAELEYQHGEIPEEDKEFLDKLEKVVRQNPDIPKDSFSMEFLKLWEKHSERIL